MKQFSIFNFQFSKLKNRENGQMLLVVLLVMVVGLSIGIFLSSRATTDISLSTKVAESSRAFNAAEAGIEEAIRAISSVPDGTAVNYATGLSYIVNKAVLGGVGMYPTSVQEPTPVNDSFTLWMVPHDDTTGNLIYDCAGCYFYNSDTIEVCYTDNASPHPALAVILVYYDLNDSHIKSSFAAYDGHLGTRSSGTTGFQTTSPVGGTHCGGVGSGYTFYAELDFSSHFRVADVAFGDRIPLALRIRPLYYPTSIAVRSLGTGAAALFPKQGNDITSTGTSGVATRRINVQEPYETLPPFMDFLIYSTGDLPLTK